jgi:hypothetical protein
MLAQSPSQVLTARSPGHPTCLSAPRSQIKHSYGFAISSARDNLYRHNDQSHFHLRLCAPACLGTLVRAASRLSGRLLRGVNLRKYGNASCLEDGPWTGLARDMVK